MTGRDITRAISRVWTGLPRWSRRIFKVAGYGTAALAAIIAVTVGVTESRCRGASKLAAAPYQSLIEFAGRRDEVNTYLTYPEWSIVHAYEDLAGVMRASNESEFGYWRSIRGFWSGLCGVKREASSRGPISFDYNSMLYTIGLSFTAEMGVKGVYETTIGRIAVWVRGATPTPEDKFALAVAGDYAQFLRQVPWYEYPFGQKLWRFWAETPVLGGNVVRKAERRVALTLEYGVKGLYARVIAVLAGLSPAPLRIRSVVSDVSGAAAVDDRISVVRSLNATTAEIETPRYREFTEIIKKLAARGANFTEIAGNRNIFVTVIAPVGAVIAAPSARAMFSVPIQARAGFVRTGYDVEVAHLCAFIRQLAGTAQELEHVYDY